MPPYPETDWLTRFLRARVSGVGGSIDAGYEATHQHLVPSPPGLMPRAGVSSTRSQARSPGAEHLHVCGNSARLSIPVPRQTGRRGCCCRSCAGACNRWASRPTARPPDRAQCPRRQPAAARLLVHLVGVELMPASSAPPPAPRTARVRLQRRAPGQAIGSPPGRARCPCRRPAAALLLVHLVDVKLMPATSTPIPPAVGYPAWWLSR